MIVDPASRLGEAIKQTKIVIEETDRQDVIEILERSLEALRRGLDTLEHGDDG